MSKELLMVVDAVANEKDLGQDEVFSALEAALAAIVRRREEDDAVLRVHIDRSNGEVRVERHWVVREDDARLDNPAGEIRLMDVQDLLDSHADQHLERQGIAQQEDQAAPGDVVIRQLPNPLLGRVAAQTTKQILLQKLREADRRRTAEEYGDRIGEVITGIVKRINKGQVYIDLGNNREGLLPARGQIRTERFKVGDRVRACLQEVTEEGHGPSLVFSRTSPEFVLALMKLEIPEAGAGVIRFHGCARDAGDRAKVSVSSTDPRLDPIGACIGMRGSRIQTITNDLGGERVDLVLWNENPAELVINALHPGEVSRIVVDEERHAMDVAVTEDTLARAIGRGGQNVRLASRLTGWTLSVQTEAQLAERLDAEESRLRGNLMEALGVDEEIADILIQEGFSTVEEIAWVPQAELLDIEGFDADIVDALRERAQESLLDAALAEESSDGDTLGTLGKEGLDADLQKALEAAGIDSVRKLGELSVDEVEELVPRVAARRELVAHLVTVARKPWLDELAG